MMCCSTAAAMRKYIPLESVDPNRRNTRITLDQRNYITLQFRDFFILMRANYNYQLPGRRSACTRKHAGSPPRKFSSAGGAASSRSAIMSHCTVVKESHTYNKITHMVCHICTYIRDCLTFCMTFYTYMEGLCHEFDELPNLEHRGDEREHVDVDTAAGVDDLGDGVRLLQPGDVHRH